MREVGILFHLRKSMQNADGGAPNGVGFGVDGGGVGADLPIGFSWRASNFYNAPYDQTFPNVAVFHIVSLSTLSICLSYGPMAHDHRTKLFPNVARCFINSSDISRFNCTNLVVI